MASRLSTKSRQLVKNQIPNYVKLSPDEQKIAALKVIKDSFYLYCEYNLMIQDKVSSQIVPFELNWAQKKLIDQVIEDIAADRPVRYIILKARQMGFSTVIEAFGYWWTTTHRHIRSVIIAHEVDASENLYNMFKRYFEHSDTAFQPTRKYNTRKDLVFDIEDNIKEEYKKRGEKPPGLDSSIKTLVAKEGKGRSATIHFFHGSEVAFWEVKADVVSSALQAIPMTKNTFAFLESTANGVGGYFYDEWQAAVKGESTFKALFFPWHSHDEYELGGKIDAYDEEELELIEIFKEKEYAKESWDRKILWRREKKKEFRTNPQEFYQEYPKDDVEAFLSSGRPVFDTKILQKWESYAQKNISHVFGEVIANPDTSSSKKYIFREVPVTFQEQDPTPLKVWDLPEKNEKYVIGVDVSEGKINNESSDKKNDYSVVDVIRQSDLKTVARWRGHIDPDLLGGVTFNIGTFYNTALVGVEVNNHGLTTVQSLRNKFYRNLYTRRTSEENQFQERTALMGWQTNRKTKPMVINNLKTAIRESDIIDLDIVFIREAMTYVVDDQGHFNAQEGTYDDTVMAKAIALKMADLNSIDAEYARENIRKPIKRNTNASKSNALDSIATGGYASSGDSGPRKSRVQQRKKHKANRRRR